LEVPEFLGMFVEAATMNILGIRRPEDGVLLAKDLNTRHRFVSTVAFVVTNFNPMGCPPSHSNEKVPVAAFAL
jgi:hypothetical protein